MTKYRVEAQLTDLSNERKWEPHIIDFDTDTDPRGIVRGRFQSIYSVMLRAIRKHEDIPNPDDYPLAAGEFPGCQASEGSVSVKRRNIDKAIDAAMFNHTAIEVMAFESALFAAIAELSPHVGEKIQPPAPEP